MKIWVQKIKTGESWLFNGDKTKEVYQDEDGIHYKEGIWAYKFLPVDPNRPAKERRGYQYNIFDYEGATKENGEKIHNG